MIYAPLPPLGFIFRRFMGAQEHESGIAASSEGLASGLRRSFLGGAWHLIPGPVECFPPSEGQYR